LGRRRRHPLRQSFIFDELAWNFEPSELGAAFGLEQLKKLDANLARRRRTFDAYTEFFAGHQGRFLLPPAKRSDLQTAWLGYPLVITETAGFQRPDLQHFLDGRGIDTRNHLDRKRVTPADAARPFARACPDGLPNADAIMERGVLLPLSHAIDDATLDFVLTTLDEFLRAH